jgi:hypothetical protein
MLKTTNRGRAELARRRRRNNMATLLTYILSITFLPIFPILDAGAVANPARDRGQLENNIDDVRFNTSNIPDSVRARVQVDRTN